jgi:hypothetical protein
MGHGAWGMGEAVRSWGLPKWSTCRHGAWVMGKGTHVKELLPIPNSQFPMPNAQCPLTTNFSKPALLNRLSSVVKLGSFGQTFVAG